MFSREIFFFLNIFNLQPFGWVYRCRSHQYRRLIIYSEVGLLDPMVVCCIWETYILFSTTDEPIYITTNNIPRFPFLHITTDNCYLPKLLMDSLIQWYYPKKGRTYKWIKCLLELFIPSASPQYKQFLYINM